MGILITPAKRYIDTGESMTYGSLDLMANPTAIIEPESIGINEFIEDEVYADVADIDTAVTDSFTKDGAETIASGETVLLSDLVPIADGMTSENIVVVDQRFARIYLTGYVDDPYIKFLAHNLTNNSEAIADGATIRYAVHTGTPAPKTLIPNAQLTVTPGFTWLDDDGNPIDPPRPLTVTGLNAAALPTISIDNGSITEVELNSNDVIKVAAAYTGRRGIITVSGNKTLTSIDVSVLLGSVDVDNPAGSIVVPGQYNASIFLTGYVASSNGVSTIQVYGRTVVFGGGIVHDGQQIKVIVY